MTSTTPRRLAYALSACARGIHHLEAGTSLLTDCGSWLHRDDFTSRFITDWEAAVTALHAGALPAS